jgi:DNA-binding FadR family transcriptional regulator
MAQPKCSKTNRQLRNTMFTRRNMWEILAQLRRNLVHWSDHLWQYGDYPTMRIQMEIAIVPPITLRVGGVSDELAAHFESLIATGVLAPGSKLPPERELAASMSVSRASLREAMHELESRHLIERTPGRGTIVMHPPREVAELQARLSGVQQTEGYVSELRQVIEPGIAGIAANRATAADILQLEKSLVVQSENTNSAESLRLDLEFHLLLSRAAQNPLLASVVSLTSQWSHEVRSRSHSTKEGRRVSLRGHRAIVDAVRAHDETAAREAMRAHLEEIRVVISKTAAN